MPLSVTSIVLFSLISALFALVVHLYIRIKDRDQKINELTQKVDGLEQTVNRLEERVEDVEVWSSENPVVLLACIDAWIEQIRQGASRVSMGQHVLPALEKICVLTSNRFWKVRVAQSLKEAENVICAKSDNASGDLEKINNLKDNFSIPSPPL